MNVLGVVLARAGSVGLKDKHLLPLLGRPVVAYTFDHAKASKRLTKVLVSSDSARVLLLAGEAKLAALMRPAELASGDASVQAVLLHAMKAVEDKSGFRADAVVTLYGNVPIRREGVIDRAIELLEETGCDSVRSFCPVGKWHPAWMSRIEGDRALALRPGSIHRRQDLEELFLHDGAVVACSREAMLRGLERPQDPHAFFGIDRRGIKTGSGETVEIDEMKDLYLAEAMLRMKTTEAVRKAS